MLEPVGEQNLREYRRLHRAQKRMVLLGPALIIATVPILVLFDWLHRAQWVVLPIVFGGIAWITILEVRKTLVFRRDLNERGVDSG
jgi:hypothetical protein